MKKQNDFIIIVRELHDTRAKFQAFKRPSQR
jgi:hypothetical protein